MASEVRRCAAADVGDFLGVCFAAFGGAVDAAEVARVTPALEPGRLLLAVEDGEAVGSAGSVPFRLSVPGGEAACAGVTMVGVLPGRRRRGAFRRLMEQVVADAHAAGEPLSVLWSTEGDLYGRFGYGLASAAARIDAARAGAALRREPRVEARVRLVEADEALATFPAIHDAVRAATPGMPSRAEAWWRIWRLGGPPGTPPAAPPLARALLEVAGRPQAYALYRVHGSWETGVSTARLEVVEALGATAEGTEEIWRFLLGLDLVERVRALHLPVDHPLFLLVREPARLRVALTDGLWLRVVDARAALAARAYAGAGEVVLELEDPACPWNEGRWLVAAGPDGALVERTTRPADVRLGAAALGSAYLGGIAFGRLAGAGLVEELRPRAADRLDALFRSGRAPWCPEEF